MDKSIKKKNVVRTYRNGKSVFQLEFVVSLKPNIKGDKWIVTERRVSFKDEKIVFWGNQTDAEQAYAEATSGTVTMANGQAIFSKVA